MSRRAGWLPLLLAGVGALVGLVLGPSIPARAHAQLLDTSPAHGSVVDDPPSRVELRFSEPVTLVGLVVQSGGAEVAGASSTDASTVVFEPNGVLPDGSTVLEWQVVSADGHPIAGTLVFHVREVTEGDAGIEPDVPVSVAALVANALMYVGLLLGGGLALFAAHVHDGGAERLILRRSALTLLAMGVVGTLASSMWRAVDAGFDAAALPAGAIPALTTAAFGVALAMVGYGRVVPVTVGVGVALLAPAFTGHTRSLDPAWLLVGADVVHVYAGAVWAGGLAAIALIGRRHPSELGALFRRFSRIAGWSLLAVLASGSTLAWTLHGSWASLVGTDHGRLALVKLAIVLGVGAVGAISRVRVAPSPATLEAGARTKLAHTAAIETAGLVLVLVIAGALVDKDPAGAQATESQGTVQTGIGDSVLTLELGAVGPGVAHVRMAVNDQNGAPAELIEPITVVVIAGANRSSFDAISGPDWQVATIEVPRSGDWGIEVGARVDTLSEAVTSLTFDSSTGRLIPTNGMLVAGALMPAPPGGSGTAAVYMSVISARDDQLVDAGSPVCEVTMLHETVIASDGTASMEHRHAIDLDAGEPLRLASGGLHIMCDTAGVEVGDTVPFWITTASSSRLDFLVPVVSITDTLE